MIENERGREGHEKRKKREGEKKEESEKRARKYSKYETKERQLENPNETRHSAYHETTQYLPSVSTTPSSGFPSMISFVSLEGFFSLMVPVLNDLRPFSDYYYCGRSRKMQLLSPFVFSESICSWKSIILVFRKKKKV